MRILPVLLLVAAACGPETTSFRTTDQGEGSDGEGPSPASYLIHDVRVRVWSNGGYMSSTDEPMTHVGFEIRNQGNRIAIFDQDSLRLVLRDKQGGRLLSVFTSLTPLGPGRIRIEPGSTRSLDAYFRMSVRPRVVQSMQIHWSLGIGNSSYEQLTSFVRDDDFPVSEPPDVSEPARASS